ncbi:cytochrome c oxidase assembly factor 8 isoform X1 [Sardina pilchardus]|uniref:cytochrome c oxidase assembly factor 8 isoform X1 n=1 Tax=Sardina pilchardus TaxID=27697 RepID=UPI002E161903
MNVSATGTLLLRSQCTHRGTKALPLIIFTCSRLHNTGQAPKQANQTKRASFSPSSSSKHDWIGPADRLSNLRPIIYHIPENETPLERRLRHLRQETEDWNHQFWANQNITFNKQKDDYVLTQLQAKGQTERDEKGKPRTLSSEEMAVFYKHFLDKNFKRHADYNREWYKRNFTITLLMARVALIRTWRRLRGGGPAA